MKRKMPWEYCEGTFRRRRVRDDYWSGKSLVIIENVPAWVCERCGEPYYDAEVMKEM